MRIGIAILGLLVAFAPGVVRADFARYERVELKELKEKGAVVGAKITMTLRPDASGYAGVAIGIVPGKGGPNVNNRVLSIDPSAGLLLHQFPRVTGIENNKPKEVTFELRFKDAPKLVPGQDFQIVSAWYHGEGKQASHVFGMSREGFVVERSFKLPMATPAAALSAKEIKARAGAAQSKARPKRPSSASKAPKAKAPRAKSRAR